MIFYLIYILIFVYFNPDSITLIYGEYSIFVRSLYHLVWIPYGFTFCTGLGEGQKRGARLDPNYRSTAFSQLSLILSSRTVAPAFSNLTVLVQTSDLVKKPGMLSSSILPRELAASAIVGSVVAGYYALRRMWVYPDRKAILGYPFLGSMLELSTTSIFDTLAAYTKLYGPVFDLFILTKRFTVLSAYEDIKETLLKRPKVFRRGSRGSAFQKIGLSEGLLAREGADWSMQRRVLAPPFSKQNVASLSEDFWTEATRFAEELKGKVETRETVDFAYAANFFTVGVIGKVAFGFTEDNGGYFYSQLFLEDLKKMLVYASQRGLFLFPEFLWRLSPKYKYEVEAVEAYERVKECGRAVLAHARSQPMGNSFIHQVIRASDESKFSDDDVISNILTFFVAGSDTTSIGICWTLFYLSQNKSILQDIRNEVNGMDASSNFVDKLKQLRLTTAAVTEALRLRGPVNMVPLQLVDNQPYTLKSGVTIYPNDMIWNNIEGVKLDANVFEDPQSFNPYRWMTDDTEKLARMNAVAQLTFGGGPRICPGMDLALMEATFCVGNIVRRFDFTLACPPSEIYRTLAVTVQINKMPFRFHLAQQ